MRKKRRSGRLKEIERELGQPPDVFIPEAIEREGSIIGAADALKIGRFALIYWMNKNGYRTEVTTKVVKVE